LPCSKEEEKLASSKLGTLSNPMVDLRWGQPAVAHQRRWCREGSLDQGELVGGIRVDGGSPQRRLHGGGARPVGKRWCWTGGTVEVLGGTS
jgi:hypothetical protein